MLLLLLLLMQVVMVVMVELRLCLRWRRMRVGSGRAVPWLGYGRVGRADCRLGGLVVLADAVGPGRYGGVGGAVCCYCGLRQC